jgi:hypothetical protein
VTWDGPTSFAYGVDALLTRLSSNAQDAGVKTFPEKVDRASVRFQGPETIKQWFDRCVKTFMPEGLEVWRLEENLAAFAIVSWRSKNELEFVTINVLKTECDLQDYFELKEEDLKEKEWVRYSKPQYIRLDLDYGTLGPIGTHPLPHVHFSAEDPPRCTLDASRSTNVVVDFMEFIYRHFFPHMWLSWVERTWDRHYKDKKRDPDRNPFPRIVSAFADNEIAVLHSLAGDLAELANVLAEEKNSLFDLRMNANDRYLMTFPDWHG